MAAEVDTPGWTRTARIAIGLAALGALAEALALGPTSWDGSYLLIQVVDRGLPYTPHARVAAAVPQAAAVLLDRAGAPYGLVRFAFAAGYAAMAPLGLALAWLVAKRAGRPDLVVWPVLTAAVLVPCAWFGASEAVVAAAFVWVPWIVAATGAPRGTRGIGALTLLAIVSLHPLGMGIAVVAVALLVGPTLWRRARPPTWQLATAGDVAVLLVLRQLFVGTDADEQGEIDAGLIVRSVGGALKGPQLLGLALLAAVGLLLFLRRDRPRLVPLVAAAGVLLVAYAALPTFWHGAHGARFAALLLPVPLTLGLLRDVLDPPPADGDGDRARRTLTVALAAVPAAALVVLAGSFWRVTDRLDGELAAAPAGCVERTDLAVDRDTLDHWSTTVVALVRQGPDPRVVVADTDAGGCDRWRSTGGKIPFEATVDDVDPAGPWQTAP